MNNGLTILGATREWVKEMDAIQHSMISELIKHDVDSWTELTVPAYGDRVYVYENDEGGEIIKVKVNDDDCRTYVVKLDSQETVEIEADDFEVERDSFLPMWGTMWSFGDSADDYWLSDLDGIALMSECGFRIYEHEEWGYFFGIDGAGYDFFEAHWVPLYKARGLQWHDERTLITDESILEQLRAVNVDEAVLERIEGLLVDGEMTINTLSEEALEILNNSQKFSVGAEAEFYTITRLVQ